MPNTKIPPTFFVGGIPYDLTEGDLLAVFAQFKSQVENLGLIYGYLVYQGPQAEVLVFFESLGFKLPPHRGVADFLQEVTSKKDQEQYWADSSRAYKYIYVPEIAEAFKKPQVGNSLEFDLNLPYDKSSSYPSALAKTKFAASKNDLFKAYFF
ncbi:ABC transporter G family member 31 [Cucumis melo var. makuwa]|uniref:ABC transporter G family member 31 n=1 Tax=Cucumis melo var. makuwa TaxID=1194695 RepID=A0A5D3DK73_CUCMM|nr:ABC transporter G family member 31 [Cucumis melo var. makuwa]TYK23997.1 ABC transporter G family member 31 [Cucumis melo var. makuwa]